MEFRFEADQDVEEAIEQAAAAACEALDSAFPGCDNGGITSNFQGSLKSVLTEMLKGRAPAQRGHATSLPALIVDETFFGDPCQPGDAFLLTKLSEAHWEFDEAHNRYRPQRHLIALQPDSSKFRPLAECGDAWTSFEAAVNAAVAHIKENGFTAEEAREQRLSIQAVAFNSNGAGYDVIAPVRATA